MKALINCIETRQIPVGNSGKRGTDVRDYRLFVTQISKLLPGSNNVWIRTRYWEVLDNLKRLLDSPETIKPVADRGCDWAFRHCRFSESRRRLREVLEIDSAAADRIDE